MKSVVSRTAPARTRRRARLFGQVAVFAALAIALLANVVQYSTAASLSVADLRVLEGNAGMTDAFFRVSLSGPISQPVTVHVQTADGSATNGWDYGAMSGDLTFLPTPGFAAKWGSWGSAPGQFEWPRGVAVSATGDVYVVDSLNCRVQKFDAFGNLQLSWGSQGNLDGQFERPSAVAVDDSGNVFVADEVSRVQKFDANGQFVLSWSPAWYLPGEPVSMAIDSAGNLNVLVAPVGNVVVVDRNLNYHWSWWTGGARAIAADRMGHLYSVGAPDRPMRQHGDRGYIMREWSSRGSGDGEFLDPAGITTDADGNVYVSDTGNHRIQKFDSAGNFLLTWAIPGGGDGALLGPTGIAVAPDGSIFVAEHDQHRVQKFAPDAGVPWAQRFRVPIQPDLAYEPADSFFVELSNPVGATIGRSPGVGTIVDDDEVLLGLPPAAPGCIPVAVQLNPARGLMQGSVVAQSAVASNATFVQGPDCVAMGNCATDSITPELRLGVESGVFRNLGTDPIEWAMGTAESPASEFMEFDSLLARYGTPAPGRRMVLHDLVTGTRLDVTWSAWGEPGVAGYGYTRSGVVRAPIASATFAHSVLPNELDLSAMPDGDAWLVVTAAPEAGGEPTRSELAFTRAGENQLVVNCSCGITIAASAGPHGTISPSGDVPVSCGGAQTFTIVPDSGCVIASVVVDGTPRPVSDTVTFTDVRDPHWIAVTFADVLPPAVHVLFPNGDSPAAENFVVGSEVVLAYDVTDNGGPIAEVTLELTRDDGLHWQTIAAATPNTGTYAWTVTGPGTNGYSHSPLYTARLRVSATDEGNNTAADSSDQPWSVFEAPAEPPAPEVGAWSEFVPAGRYYTATVYDPVRDQLVVFGGNGRGSMNDVWTLSLSGAPLWTQLHPTGAGPRLDQPMPRQGHSAIYDPVRDRVVIFGARTEHPVLTTEVWTLSLSGCPAWTKLEPLGTGPSGRLEQVAVYDPVRDCMIVHGGMNPGASAVYGDVWALSLNGEPEWSEITPAGTAPAPRHGHAACYDSAHDRLVVMGGANNNDTFGDSWALSLGSSPAWTELAPSGSGPTVRAWHTLVYDPAGDRAVLYGGQRWGAFYDDDVWSLALGGSPAWTEVTVSGTPLPVRWGHSAVYDPVRQRMLSFAGVDHSGLQNDVWTLALTGAPAGGVLPMMARSPSPRVSPAAVYDSTRGRMIVFGGSAQGVGPRNEMWSLPLTSGAGWSQLVEQGGAPLDRNDCTVVLDPVRDRLLIFGGEDRITGERGSEVWTCSLAGSPAWSVLAVSGAPPAGRTGHRAFYDPSADRMIVFGGQCAPSDPGNTEVWELSLSGTPTWALLAPAGAGPSVRTGASVIHDRVSDRMIVFGGSGSAIENDTWAFALSGSYEWTEFTPSGAPPMARLYHTAIYDELRQRMVVFGGLGAPSEGPIVWLNDVWALSLSGSPAWSELSPPEERPLARYAHTAIYDAARDRMVIYGGTAGAEPWALTWSPAVSAIAGANGTIEPSGTVSVHYGGQQEFSIQPNGGYAVNDVRVNGTSVGPVSSYSMNNVQCDGTIMATFREVTSVPPASGTLGWALAAPAPNPAQGGWVRTEFTLPVKAHVQLELFDAAGRRVTTLAEGDFAAGRHAVEGDMRSVRPGIYWLQLRADGRRIARSIVRVP